MRLSDVVDEQDLVVALAELELDGMSDKQAAEKLRQYRKKARKILAYLRYN